MRDDTNEARVYNALVALMGRCEIDSYVIIAESDSGKFVQFGRGPAIEIDVPCVSLTGAEVENASQFFEALGEKYYPRKEFQRDSKTGKVTHCLTFTHDCGQDARAAAKAAIEALWVIYGITSDAELLISEN
jgi:hypothetical protein